MAELTPGFHPAGTRDRRLCQAGKIGSSNACDPVGGGVGPSTQPSLATTTAGSSARAAHDPGNLLSDNLAGVSEKRPALMMRSLWPRKAQAKEAAATASSLRVQAFREPCSTVLAIG